jgi:hypothetical protein
MNSDNRSKPPGPFTGAPPHAQNSERVRQALIDSRIAGARRMGTVNSDGTAISADEIYAEFYTDANRYWTAALSEPMTVLAFKRLLQNYFFGPEHDSGDLYKMEIEGALRLARDAGEQWFIETPGAELLLDPLKASAWLLAMPKRRHVLPTGLRSFIEAAAQPEAPIAKPRIAGPVPEKAERVAAEMRLMPRQKLIEMKLKEMEPTFRAGKTLCAEARRRVLDETPENDK